MPEDPRVPTEGLKEFQRRTVEYVFERLYGPNATDRFLVADEVGLGKTLVARGIIARAIEHLKPSTKRIDVIYVCSNAAIAGQNVKRLIPEGYNRVFPIATRLTYLPVQVRSLRAKPVNFISITPNTTFDHTRSRGGQSRERAILFHLLTGLRFPNGAGLRRDSVGLLNLLQGASRRERWRQKVEALDPRELDQDIKEAFHRSVLNDTELSSGLLDGCARFRWHRDGGKLPDADSGLRYELIAKLRNRLASECLSALEPDLVILDEFQRFKDLLDEPDDSNEAAELAQQLFKQPDVKLLLLSATPYKMYSLDNESAEDDHYPDFLRTLGFLMGDPAKVAEVEHLIAEHRRALQALGSGARPDLNSKRRLEEALLRVMCRTERVSMTRNYDSMLVNEPREVYPTAADLKDAAAVGDVSERVGAGDQVEYWKSAPYLLSFMGDYELRKRLERDLADPPADVRSAVAVAAGRSLKKARLERYDPLEPANARLRSLIGDTIGQGLWELLWMPASLPYMEPAGVYRGKDRLTKALVFSSWSAVPDAIASVCSYEAERRMVENADVGGEGVTRSELRVHLKPLLRFAASSVDGRLTGMPVIAWLLPSPTLATAVDPLKIALQHGVGPMDAAALRSEARAVCEHLVGTLPDGGKEGRADERWYWAAPILLETGDGLLKWCRAKHGWRAVVSADATADEADDGTGSMFARHIDLLADVAEGRVELGPKPADLADVLCDLALGAPGVLALRALLRLGGGLEPSDRVLLDSAARVAGGFLRLFNMPEARALLRSGEDETTYWRLTLRYACDGNLQAVLDEYVHVLRESLGLQSRVPAEQVAEIGKAIANVLGLRTAQVRVDELRHEGRGFAVEPFNVRSRFAMRFAKFKGKDEEGAQLRAESVRDAFNSPFRPFVLASTSIGQEGLDFHTWCHAVVHWNLPSNPVDLEQREGRVHRYKGHAVRKNIAERYGLRVLEGTEGWTDPWQAIFELAAAEAGAEGRGLVPYWVFEGGSARIERRVPLTPYSREVGKLEALKSGLALYRLVFGQPRQEDLMAAIGASQEPGRTDRMEWLISLVPPAASSNGD